MGQVRFARFVTSCVLFLAAAAAHAAPGDALTPLVSLGRANDNITALSAPGGEFVVVTRRTVAGGYDTYVQPFDAAGVAQAAAVRLVGTMPTWDSLSVSLDKNGNVLAAWQPVAGLFYARRFDRYGNPQSKQVQVADERKNMQKKNGGCGGQQAAGGTNASFAVVWFCVYSKGSYPDTHYSSKLRLRVFSTKNAVGGPAIPVGTDPTLLDSYVDLDPQLVVDASNYIGVQWRRVVFEPQPGTEQLMNSTFGPAGAPLNREGSVDYLNEIALYNQQLGGGSKGWFISLWRYSGLEHIQPFDSIGSYGAAQVYDDYVRRKLCVKRNNDYLTAWTDAGAIHGEYFRADGSVQGQQATALPVAGAITTSYDCDADGDLLVTFAKSQQVSGVTVVDHWVQRYAGQGP